MDVCIKNIDEEEWRTFKVESVRHRLKMGDFFNKLVSEHEKRCKESNWENILLGEKKLKGALERKDLDKIKAEFRESFKMRIE
ncbi:MAG: hypothetical protein V2A62_00210 [Candidatus Woesearchaeota archaeon]